MSQSWQFISSQPHGGNLDPDARRLVRENAMRSFRRGQRRRKVADFQQKQPVVEAVEAVDEKSPQTNSLDSVAVTSADSADLQERTPEERQHEQACSSEKQTVVLRSEPGDALDPFRTTAMYSHHDAPGLFMHFVNVIAPMLQPFGIHSPVVSLWPLYALQDTSMLESLLFHAAIHIDTRSGRPWTLSTLYHRGRCIQLLSERFSGPGDVATSNSVIGAVGLMSAAGNITGAVNKDLVHRKALHRMVEMRGGLENLGSDGFLRMVLPIGDLISAAVTDSDPMLEPPEAGAAAALFDLELPETFARPVRSSLGLPSFRVEIFALISFIDKLAALHANSIDALISSTQNMIAFSQICSSVEHRLLSIRLRKSSNVHPDVSVYEAVRIAGLMCMTYLFRKMNPTGAIFVNLHKRLRATIDALESSSTVILDQDSMRFLLWAVSVASLTALDPAWLARRIHRQALELDIRNLDDLSNCLACFVWSPKMALDFDTIWQHFDPLLELFSQEQ